MKLLKRFLVGATVFLSGWLVVTHAIAQIKPAAIAADANVRFNGTLLVASDADQIGTAYANGVVNKVAGVEDSLTLLQFDAAGNFTKRQMTVTRGAHSLKVVR